MIVIVMPDVKTRVKHSTIYKRWSNHCSAAEYGKIIITLLQINNNIIIIGVLLLLFFFSYKSIDLVVAALSQHKFLRFFVLSFIHIF